MTNYEQHLNHWKNHSKDKSYQQCSGYGGDGISKQLTEDEIKGTEVHSFIKLLEELKDVDFPVYIRCHGDGLYTVCDAANLFGNKIESYDELIKFGNDYVFGGELNEAQ